MDSKRSVIIQFWLPPTFPAFLIPANETRFLSLLLGMSLPEAIAAAAGRGLQPTTEPLPEAGEGMHHFTLVMDNMVVPLAVRIGEVPRVMH